MNGGSSSNHGSHDSPGRAPDRSGQFNVNFGFRSGGFGVRGRGRNNMNQGNGGRTGPRGRSPPHNQSMYGGGMQGRGNNYNRNRSTSGGNYMAYKQRPMGRSRDRSRSKDRMDRRGASRDRSRDRFRDRSRDRRRDSFPRDHPDELQSNSSPEKLDRSYADNIDVKQAARKEVESNDTDSRDEEGLVTEDSPRKTPVRRPSWSNASSPVVKPDAASTRRREADESPVRRRDSVDVKRRGSIAEATSEKLLKRSESMIVASATRRPSLDLKRSESLTLPKPDVDDAANLEPPRPPPSDLTNVEGSSTPSDDRDSQGMKRVRLGWGQGLAAASSPSAATLAAKRPRIGWGQGLMSQASESATTLERRSMSPLPALVKATERAPAATPPRPTPLPGLLPTPVTGLLPTPTTGLLSTPASATPPAHSTTVSSVSSPARPVGLLPMPTSSAAVFASPPTAGLLPHPSTGLLSSPGLLPLPNFRDRTGGSTSGSTSDSTSGSTSGSVSAGPAPAPILPPPVVVVSAAAPPEAPVVDDVAGVAPVVAAPPRKEDLLVSIDALDADIGRVKSQIAATRDEFEALKMQPLTFFDEVEEPAVVVVTPKPKTRPVIMDPELMATVSAMMTTNCAKATEAAANLDTLGTAAVRYATPGDAPGVSEILTHSASLRPRVLSRIMARKAAHYTKMRQLAVEFVQLKKAWRHRVKRIEKDKKKQEKIRSKLLLKQQKKTQATTATDTTAAADEAATNSSSVRTSSRLTNNSSNPPLLPTLQTGLEKDSAAQWEQDNRRKRLKGAMVASGSSASLYVIPDMLLDEDRLCVQRFVKLPRPTLTGLETPSTPMDGQLAVAVEKLTNPWSDVEKCIYVDKFLQFPKQFYQIGTYLKNKTTGDVIAFYYNTKKVVDYKAIIREQQLRRRGAGIKNTWNCWHLSVCVAMALGVQFPDSIKAMLLQPSNFRSHQAANCILHAVKGVKDAAANDDTASTTNDDDKESKDGSTLGVPPMVLDLTTLLSDNAYSTGYETSSVSVRQRFLDFRASSQYQPDPPPVALDNEPIKVVSKLKLKKDVAVADAMPSPASRRKSGTRAANPMKKDSKRSAKLKREDAPKRAKVSPTNVQDDAPPPPTVPEASSPMREKKSSASKPPPPAQLPLLPPPPMVAPPQLLSKHTNQMLQLSVPLHVPVLHTPSPSGGMHHPSLLPTPMGQPPSVLSSLPPGKRVVQKWTEQEKSDFLKFFSVYGKDWSALTNSIPTKTAAQIKNYYQNYKNRLGLQDILKKRTERITSTGSGPNTPQSGPTPGQASPTALGSPPPTYAFPMSMPPLQPQQTSAPVNNSNEYNTVYPSTNARHKLLQLQCELSRITMQQLPPEAPSNSSNPTSMAYSTINSQASQMKLLQYSLQQQVQMLQMQIHQQELQSNAPYAPRPLQERMHLRPATDNYYDPRYSDMKMEAPQQPPIVPRPHLDTSTERSSSLPPLAEAPPIAIPQPTSRSLMSFSSILNESNGSPYGAQTPPTLTPVHNMSRSSVSSLLNRHHRSAHTPPANASQQPHAVQLQQQQLQQGPSAAMKLHLSHPLRQMAHPSQQQQQHPHQQQQQQQQQSQPQPQQQQQQGYYGSAPSLPSHLHQHGPSSRNPYASVLNEAAHSDMTYSGQSFQQQLQQRQMQQTPVHYAMDKAPPSDAESVWTMEQQMRYEEEAQSLHRAALEKEAFARRAEEEATRAAAAAAAAARALQEAQAARQEAMHLAANAARYTSHMQQRQNMHMPYGHHHPPPYLHPIPHMAPSPPETDGPPPAASPRESSSTAPK
ncbi:hypothetical protein SPRG_01149 [Saprolegnia parasitica CBS 223.65]|uniref:SANT domain-containing protein n=1 Tax=Saprolegnia parasitica (strain CBS 223.65) TaxID=695850 RepID=A0A067CWK5_SAPPC|nr:hypothetical protein SPRG_01149 [Saprolegnia parasitica CBS 223.65]KDO35084.1 hypothetical protein SPRG_01149 [Saprolegnia parasitica CBS 223.65]|eukprot:XP_012194736.1 hypothetical protein SPRG_01149 [Saprolegnia parasitica CBS 223.65]